MHNTRQRRSFRHTTFCAGAFAKFHPAELTQLWQRPNAHVTRLVAIAFVEWAESPTASNNGEKVEDHGRQHQRGL